MSDQRPGHATPLYPSHVAHQARKSSSEVTGGPPDRATSSTVTGRAITKAMVRETRNRRG